MNRRFYYTGFLIFISFNLCAQIKIQTRADSLFFIGIDNEVIIQSSKIPVGKLSIDVKSASVSGRNGHYILRFSGAAKHVVIKIFYSKKLVAEKTMEVVRVSDPIIYVAGDTLVTGGTISKKHLLTFDSLIVKTNVSYLPMSVIGFEFKRIANDRIIDSLKNTGYLFSPTIKNILRKAVTGDVINFDEAFYTGPDNNSTIYQSIKLTVGD